MAAPLRAPRRLLRSPIVRALLVAFAIWNVVEVWYIRARLGKPERHRDRFGRPPRVYIASLHWNGEALLRDYWNKAVLDLVDALGRDHVFLSVYESGSWDNTPDYLRELDHQLEKSGVNRSIIIDATSHLDAISAKPPEEDRDGWVTTPEGTRKLRRVPFLASLRNKSMQKFHELVAQGVVFDTVLFLNDIVFTAEDVLELLYTNEREYAAACSLDFSKAPYFYDTFALRDSQGHEHAGQAWPYFRSSASRKAMKLGIPVPVSSCWNGMVAMPAGAFRSYDKATKSGLSFRGIDDTLAAYHLEGSECCLIHADNPLTSTHGVYLNPNVRVGYNAEAYQAVNPSGCWVSWYGILSGLWKNRIHRWSTAPFIALKEWKVEGRVKNWQKQDPNREEKGQFCLVNEMHVIVGNGWAHV